jgi:hypothetical protein
MSVRPRARREKGCAMSAPVLPDKVLARYRQFMLGTITRITADEVAELLGAAREYLAAVSGMKLSSEADHARARKVRVELRNAAKGLLNRVPGLEAGAREALEEFIAELPEFLADDYKFTADFFSTNIDTWRQSLARFEHRPGLHFLEIGSFEGLSACWLLNNILTDDSSRLTCIDTFDFAGQGTFYRLQDQGTETMSIEQRFDHNVGLAGGARKVIKIVGQSGDALRTLPRSAYDYIYIDGSHVAADVLEDAVLSWPLLKRGGLMTFDDYQWNGDPNPLNRPGLAVDAFLAVFKTRYKLVHKGYQVTVEKL